MFLNLFRDLFPFFCRDSSGNLTKGDNSFNEKLNILSVMDETKRTMSYRGRITR